MTEDAPTPSPPEPEADLFPDAPAPEAAETAGPVRAFSGQLLHHAEVRTALDEAGRTVPCIQFELASDGPAHLPIRVQQLFPHGNTFAAEAAARRYRKGAHVTVQASVLGLRLTIPAAHHIHLDQEATA
jgi:hypothetical protein